MAILNHRPNGIVLYRSLAELAIKNLKKGSCIYLEGKLKTKTWEDKAGVKKQATEIVGESFIMLDKRSDNLHTNTVEPALIKTEVLDGQGLPTQDESLPF